jgi:hypothetical protein
MPVRWVQGARERGTVLPAPRGGGWYSPVDLPLLHALVTERPDRTTEELTRAYNQRAAPEAPVHRSSLLRALQRTGYVIRPYPAENTASSCGIWRELG